MIGKPTLEEQENVLIERLTVINNKIKELEHEAVVIRNHLNDVRKSNTSLKDVKRISSVNRALVEKMILDIIKAANGPIKTSAIEINLQARFIGVKSTTFRSHLKRMHSKDLIAPYKHGYWTKPKK